MYRAEFSVTANKTVQVKIYQQYFIPYLIHLNIIDFYWVVII